MSEQSKKPVYPYALKAREIYFNAGRVETSLPVVLTKAGQTPVALRFDIAQLHAAIALLQREPFTLAMEQTGELLATFNEEYELVGDSKVLASLELFANELFRIRQILGK